MSLSSLDSATPKVNVQSELKAETELMPETPSSYWGEFRQHWRALAAATIGLSSAMSLNAYVSSIFGPYLLDAFNWSKSAFALMGALSLVTLIIVPLMGRLTDLFGVTRVALIGIIGYPTSLLLLSLMSGDIRTFYIIIFAQAIICMSTTTVVYCRVVAERFKLSRGMALAICACGPAVAGALASPLLTTYNDTFGWRAGYQALAIFSAVMGIITLILLPKEMRNLTTSRQARNAKKDYGTIFSNPAFWIILVGTFLCSLPHALAYSQVKVMLLEHGVNSIEAGYMVSVFAGGVLLGRFVAGIALDHLPTYLVAALIMGLPCVGMFIMATPTTSIILLGVAVLFLGLSFGGESDVLTYTAAQYFPMEIYSTVAGLLISAVGVAIGAGSLLLSYTLTGSESFRVFMLIVGTTSLIGSLIFIRLRFVSLDFPKPV